MATADFEVTVSETGEITSINEIPVGPRAEEAHYIKLAKSTSDPMMAKGYQKLAKKARKAARK